MSEKTPVVLISCGSFNPITYAHLRLFEVAKDYLNKTGRYEVLGGIVSPVHDKYKKSSLISSKYRNEMVKLSLKDNDWVKLETWETEQNEYTETYLALGHYQKHVNQTYGPHARLMLLCGADLVISFSVPGLWKDEHTKGIVEEHGLACINRVGSDVETFINKTDILLKNKNNIHVITNSITNDISSTSIREAVLNNESIKYLVHDDVIKYIKDTNLYKAAASATASDSDASNNNCNVKSGLSTVVINPKKDN